VRIEVKSILYSLSLSLIYSLLALRLILCTLATKKKQKSYIFFIKLILIFEFDNETPQSLRFDTLYIALSYGIRPIVSDLIL
jgi:hypothetical protein